MREKAKVEAATSVAVTPIIKASDGATVTRVQTKELKDKHRMMRSFNDLDGYLRGTKEKTYRTAYEHEQQGEQQEEHEGEEEAKSPAGASPKRQQEEQRRRRRGEHVGTPRPPPPPPGRDA